MKIRTIKEWKWECSDTLSAAAAEVYEYKEHPNMETEYYFRLYWAGNVQSPLLYFANEPPDNHMQLKACCRRFLHFLFE